MTFSVTTERFRITAGEPKLFAKKTDNGRRGLQFSCANCGCPIYNTGIDEVCSFTDREREQSHNASYVLQVINRSLIASTAGRPGRGGVVGACNNPSVMDAAILRPSRLDHHIGSGYPDAEARVENLRLHLRGNLPDADFSPFAGDSFCLAGADIAGSSGSPAGSLVAIAGRSPSTTSWRACRVGSLLEKFRWALVAETCERVGYEAPSSSL